MSDVETQKKEILRLEQQLKDAREANALWLQFIGMTSQERKDLVNTYTGPYSLREALATLSGRPPHKYKYPGNYERMYEDAGNYADTYRGGGWMMIRQLLIDFHQHMTYLETTPLQSNAVVIDETNA